MREVALHRRADRYLDRLPRRLQAKLVGAIEEVAALPDIEQHRNVRALTGGLRGWYRLRVGVYRSVMQIRFDEKNEILYVDYIGPRGDAY